MTSSNFNSAVIMGFFAAAIGVIVICFASIQESQADANGHVNSLNSETYTSASAEDVLRP